VRLPSILIGAVLSATAVFAAPLLAQQPVLSASNAEGPSDRGSVPGDATNVQSFVHPGATAKPAGKLETYADRWLDVNDLSFSFRYRKEVENDDLEAYHNGQQKSLVDGRFKFDSGGKYAVNFRVSSGRTFNWAYTDEIGEDFQKRLTSAAAFTALSPAQLQAILGALVADSSEAAQADSIYSRSWTMNLRQLYFSAAPIKQVALEYGSLYIERGVSTEATTYDDDGYITGERVRIFDPKHLFFDQVAFTNAYEGDIITPNFFQRGERLKEANYRQFLVARQFRTRIQTSADYTFDKETHTTREAVLAELPEIKAIDSVRLELYQRLNDHVLSGQTYHAHQGFTVTGSKTFYRKFQLDGGYAHIDDDYGVLTGERILAAAGFSMNGDAFLTGNRAFTRANWKVAPGVVLYGFYTHTTATAPPAAILFNKEGLNGGMTFDFKSLLARAKVL
jgi:hypothetical protein